MVEAIIEEFERIFLETSALSKQAEDSSMKQVVASLFLHNLGMSYRGPNNLEMMVDLLKKHTAGTMEIFNTLVYSAVDLGKKSGLAIRDHPHYLEVSQYVAQMTQIQPVLFAFLQRAALSPAQ